MPSIAPTFRQCSRLQLFWRLLLLTVPGLRAVLSWSRSVHFLPLLLRPIYKKTFCILGRPCARDCPSSPLNDWSSFHWVVQLRNPFLAATLQAVSSSWRYGLASLEKRLSCKELLENAFRLHISGWRKRNRTAQRVRL